MPQFVLYDQFGVKKDPVLIRFPWKPDQKFNPDFFGVKLDPEPIFEPNPHSEFRISRWLPMVVMVYKNSFCFGSNTLELIVSTI